MSEGSKFICVCFLGLLQSFCRNLEIYTGMERNMPCQEIELSENSLVINQTALSWNCHEIIYSFYFRKTQVFE